MLYTKYLHILHHLQAMKMTYLELFLICTFKDPKLAEKRTKLAENPKKIELRGVRGVRFFQVFGEGGGVAKHTSISGEKKN